MAWYTTISIGEVTAITIALSSFVAVFTTKRTSAKTQELIKTETVDGDVLGQFKEVLERVAKLEKQLTRTRFELVETQTELTKALEQLAELRKLESYLQERLVEKENEIREMRKTENRHISQIRSMKEELGKNRARITELEIKCKELP